MFVHAVYVVTFLGVVSLIVAHKESFYVYDWPEATNRYANHSDKNHISHGVEIPQWIQFGGAGRLVNRTFMEHKTSQFALFKLIYERALVDKRRTLNPVEATSFLIPFDLGMHSAFTESNGRMKRTGCPLGKDVVNRLVGSSFFKAKYGYDHVLIVSINQNMNYFMGAPKCVELLKACWNCTKLSIDEYLFTATDRAHEISNLGINWHAIPFPSDYHYSPAGNALPPWMSTAPRPSLVSFVGSSRRFNEVATAIRESLVHQCRAHKGKCVQGTYKHDERYTLNHISRQSIFCLQPPGDMPTRKSLFDAVLSGCIPVLFHPLTARYMYEWHWGQSNWEKVAVHFDSSDENSDLINHKVDFIQKLIDMVENNATDIVRRQIQLRQMAFNLQYSLIYSAKPAQQPVGAFKENATVATVVVAARGPQGERDAYDIAMDNVLAIHSGKQSHDRRSHYVMCAQVGSRHTQKVQTSDWCNSTHSSSDPFHPPALVSPFFKGV